MSFSGVIAGSRGGRGGAAAGLIAYAPANISTAGLQDLVAEMASEIGEREGGGVVELPNRPITLTEPLAVRSHVWLRGSGPGSMLKAASSGFDDSEASAVLINADPADRRFRISDLALDAGNVESAIVIDTPDTPGQEYADGVYSVEALEVFDAGQDAVVFRGRGQGIVRNLRVRDQGRHAYVIESVDSVYDALENGGGGAAGLVVRGSNNRFANCKFFWNGNTTPADGHGIWLDGSLGGQHAVFVNCETQDNNGHGILFQDFHDVRVENHISEGNNAGNNGAANQGGCAYYVDGSSDIKIQGSALGRGSNAQQQRYAIGMVNGAENLRADLTSQGNLSGHILNGWHYAVDIRINNYEGNQDISYAASRTPNPTLGRKMWIGPLTGNSTINNPSAANFAVGSEMEIAILQDGTGGRTVTWGSEFALGGFTPTTTANRVNLYRFVRYPAAWVLVSANAGVDFTSFL